MNLGLWRCFHWLMSFAPKIVRFPVARALKKRSTWDPRARRLSPRGTPRARFEMEDTRGLGIVGTVLVIAVVLYLVSALRGLC